MPMASVKPHHQQGAVLKVGCVLSWLFKLPSYSISPFHLDRFYEAVIEDILPESETVAVSFPEHGKSDICQMSALKPLPAGKAAALPGSSQTKSKTMLK